jgi:hypothetical protein
MDWSSYPAQTNIFRATESQRQANVAFLWLVRNDPAASTIGVRALVRAKGGPNANELV